MYTREQAEQFVRDAAGYSSPRMAAAALGISRATLNAMVSGKWFKQPHIVRREKLKHAPPPLPYRPTNQQIDWRWCPECGAPVVLPCAVCGSTVGKPWKPRTHNRHAGKIPELHEPPRRKKYLDEGPNIHCEDDSWLSNC